MDDARPSLSSLRGVRIWLSGAVPPDVNEQQRNATQFLSSLDGLQKRCSELAGTSFTAVTRVLPLLCLLRQRNTSRMVDVRTA